MPGGDGPLAWLDAPDRARGLRTLRGDAWALTPYDELAARARAGAVGLRELGVGTDDVVALADEEPVAFVRALLAVLRCGAAAVVLPPPAQDADEAARRVRAAGARLVLADDEGARAALAPCAGVAVRALPSAPGHLDATPRAPDATAVLQFTSGSTAAPRAVRITWRNLEANIAAIRAWLGWGADDAGALWLPFHHDMGLVGTLTALSAQADLWQLTPRQFLTAPQRWLACLGGGGATMTAGPTFAYPYAARRARPDDLARLDLSGWRHAIVGAERVTPAALAQTAAALAPRGFDPATLRPAYGMAEATLAATGVPAGAPARALRTPHGLRFGAAVVAAPLASWGAAADGAADALVSCGAPLAGVEVTIRDDAGAPLPPGALGEIHLRGASVSPGYLDADDDGGPAGATRVGPGGELRTGDAGFLHDGELYVVGRMGASIKARGRHVACEALEAAVGEALGLPGPGCVVVPHAGAAVLVLERDPGTTERAAAELLVRRQLGPGVTVSTAVRPIPRTTSGKPRRSELWRALLEAGGG